MSIMMEKIKNGRFTARSLSMYKSILAKYCQIMTKPQASVNAGVHAATGFEFQKHCALHILIENYSKLRSKKYFICIEHHDDFLFCYQTDEDLINLIEAFQAKKSSTSWTIDTLHEIIKKIIDTGEALLDDKIKKTNDYTHTLNFITNNTINLAVTEKKKKTGILVNEANVKVEYLNLDRKLKDAILTKITALYVGVNPPIKELNHLDYLTLCYIDLGRTSKSQLDNLVGAFSRTFGATVKDHDASVKTLIKLFREIELTFNQGSKTALLDNTKRIDSHIIKSTMNMIESKQMAYDLWRDKKDVLVKVLDIKVLNQESFKMDFVSSFDLFKDLSQAEHQKILRFAKTNIAVLNDFTTDEECIMELHNRFKKANNTQLTELQLKAVICAAYVEIKG